MGNSKTCAFFGHRNVTDTDNIGKKLYELIKNLIVYEDFSVFLFGSFGDFDDICYHTVSLLKQQFPHIKRILYVVNDYYLKKYQLKNNNGILYEDVVYPNLEFDFWYTRIYYRNCYMICYMIDISDFIVFYANDNMESGAYKALKYAVKTKKSFVNLINADI